MAIYQLDHLIPQLHPSVYVAPSAEVIGDAHLEEGCSIWFGAVIRADTEAIRIASGSNVQDQSMLHADAGVPLTIGRQVTIGHQVMLHGCSIGDGCLIGIQSVVLNNARIGKNCLVGAGSVVMENQTFPDDSLIVGAPARWVRTLRPEQIKHLHETAAHYQTNALRFARRLQKIRD